MSTSKLMIQKQLKLLDFDTNRTKESECNITENLNKLPFLHEDIVTQFYVNQGTIYCVNETGQIAFYLVHHDSIENGGIEKIDRSDIDGIPGEYFSHVINMRTFLSGSYKRLVEYTDHSGFKLKVDLKLKGGGNMMAPGEGYKWPVMGSGENAKIVIPYQLKGSPQYCEARKILDEPQTSKRRSKLLAGIEKGQYEKIKLEKEAHESINTAIQEWNETGIVELIPIATYEQRYGVSPKRWVGFRTNNKNGTCQAPCIGMCPGTGEHIISCDIEGRFHSNPVQSIMHEIGHVIGLRHEHARSDRDKYIATNLNEDLDGIAFGRYDFYSIMHYELGNYGEHDYLLLSKTMLDERSVKNINKLRKEVGKMPRISAGDIDTVRKLYSAEFQSNIKENNEADLNERFSILSLSNKNTTNGAATVAAPASASASVAYHYSIDSKVTKEKVETQKAFALHRATGGAMTAAAAYQSDTSVTSSGLKQKTQGPNCKPY